MYLEYMLKTDMVVVVCDAIIMIFAFLSAYYWYKSATLNADPKHISRHNKKAAIYSALAAFSSVCKILLIYVLIDFIVLLIKFGKSFF